jgi:hypothetical protein
MRAIGLEGVIRGKPVRTTISAKAAPCPLDHVNRQFRAPGRTCFGSRTSLCLHLDRLYLCPFGIDAYARRIVGWRVSRTAHAGFVLDAPD